MEFRLESALYYCEEPEYLEIIIPYITRTDGDKRYIEVGDIAELGIMVKDIAIKYNNILDDYGWPPDSVVIDFDTMSVLLRDHYIE